jgi:hypothetical protein
MKSEKLLFTAGSVYLFLFISVASFTSCTKDDFDLKGATTVNWSPEIAIPLIYSEIGINELVKTSDSAFTITTDENYFCKLLYDGNIFTLNAHQLAAIPDYLIQKEFNLTQSDISTLNNTGTFQITSQEVIDLPLAGGAEADSMYLESADLAITITSDFPVDATILITIPGLTNGGTVFQSAANLNFNGTSPLINNHSFPLNNYRFDLSDGGVTHNKLRINYTIVFNGNSQAISPSNKIVIEQQFTNVEYTLLYGYLGQQSIANIQDSLAITLFNNSTGSGSFTVAEPTVTFNFRNSLGIPLSARISQLAALHPNLIDFTVATGIPDPLPVISPQLNEIGETKQSSFTLDKNNSNIATLFNQQPKYLLSQLHTMFNPSGRCINYLTDSSELAVDIHAEIPFYGTAKDFVITDSVPFSYNDLEKVEELTLKINIENGFPLESSIQLIFTDEHWVHLDSVFVPGEIIIPSGIIDPVSSRVVIPGQRQVSCAFNADKLNKIIHSKNIIVTSSATTTGNGNQNVKIFSDYKLKIKVGALIKLKM